MWYRRYWYYSIDRHITTGHRPPLPPLARSLEEESRQLDGAAASLQQRLAEARGSLSWLEESRRGLERDIDCKSHSLFIERDKCLKRRERYPTVSTLSGYWGRRVCCAPAASPSLRGFGLLLWRGLVQEFHWEKKVWMKPSNHSISLLSVNKKKKKLWHCDTKATTLADLLTLFNGRRCESTVFRKSNGKIYLHVGYTQMFTLCTCMTQQGKNLSPFPPTDKRHATVSERW